MLIRFLPKKSLQIGMVQKIWSYMVEEDIASAAVSNRWDQVFKLLNYGVDVDNFGNFAMNALHGASIAKRADVVALLLQAGANPNALTKDYPDRTRPLCTALHIAISIVDVTLARLFILDVRTDLALPDQVGQTALQKLPGQGRFHDEIQRAVQDRKDIEAFFKRAQAAMSIGKYSEVVKAYSDIGKIFERNADIERGSNEAVRSHYLMFAFAYYQKALDLCLDKLSGADKERNQNGLVAKVAELKPYTTHVDMIIVGPDSVAAIKNPAKEAKGSSLGASCLWDRPLQIPAVAQAPVCMIPGNASHSAKKHV